MGCRIGGGVLTGTIQAPFSKSCAERNIICAAFAESETVLDFVPFCDDVRVFLNCIKKLGADFRVDDGKTVISPIKSVLAEPSLFFGKSGAAMRFFIPVCSLLCNGFSADGDEGLRLRPLGEASRLLRENDVIITSEALPLRATGKISASSFSVHADISSQYASGLALALAASGRGGTITLEGKIKSYPYIELTVATINSFGVKAEIVGRQICIASGVLRGGKYKTERDWSNSSFWLCAGAICGAVRVRGMVYPSKQADSAILDALRRFGADVRTGNGDIIVYAKKKQPFDFDVTGCPDLAMPLAVLMCAADGRSRITGADALRYKESDRLSGLFALIENLGGSCAHAGSSIIINGRGALNGGCADAMDDHRLAMTAALLSCLCENAVVLNNSECVKKSYDGFFEDFIKLGGNIEYE